MGLGDWAPAGEGVGEADSKGESATSGQGFAAAGVGDGSTTDGCVAVVMEDIAFSSAVATISGETAGSGSVSFWVGIDVGAGEACPISAFPIGSDRTTRSIFLHNM